MSEDPGAQLGNELHVHQLAHRDRIAIVQDRSGRGHEQHGEADQEEDALRGQISGRSGAERLARRWRPRLHRRADDVHGKTREPEPREPEHEEQDSE